MNLYLISQTQNDNYDTFDSAVVAAEHPAKARIMNPGGINKEIDLSTWTSPEFVKVELIGEAIHGTKEGVICASYNAG